MAKIAVVHGPNLNLLGQREPHIYGTQTLATIDQQLVEEGRRLGHEVECFQSNHEGALVDHIQGLIGRVEALVLNAAAYTHTSVALRDALAALVDIPKIEVHLSIPGAREPFRRTNLLEGVVSGRIEGFGSMSYLLALSAASGLIARRGELRDE